MRLHAGCHLFVASDRAVGASSCSLGGSFDVCIVYRAMYKATHTTSAPGDLGVQHRWFASEVAVGATLVSAAPLDAAHRRKVYLCKVEWGASGLATAITLKQNHETHEILCVL